MSNEPVTITINRDSHYQNRRVDFLGQKVKLGRNAWFLSNQRIKNKQMVHRMLKKEYSPYVIVTSVFNGTSDSSTLTLKPYNF